MSSDAEKGEGDRGRECARESGGEAGELGRGVCSSTANSAVEDPSMRGIGVRAAAASDASDTELLKLDVDVEGELDTIAGFGDADWTSTPNVLSCDCVFDRTESGSIDLAWVSDREAGTVEPCTVCASADLSFPLERLISATPGTDVSPPAPLPICPFVAGSPSPEVVLGEKAGLSSIALARSGTTTCALIVFSNAFSRILSTSRPSERSSSESSNWSRRSIGLGM